MEEILNILVNSSNMDNAIDSVVMRIREVAFNLSPMFTAIMLAFVFIKSVWNGAKINVQDIFSNVVWSLIVVALLVIYNPLTGFIDTVMMGIYVEIKTDGNLEGSRKLNGVLNEVERNQEKLSEGGTVESLGTTIGNWWDTHSPSGIVLGSVNMLLSVAIKSVGVVMMGLALMVTKLLRCLGPLALAFSILPICRKVSDKWLLGFLNAYGAVIVVGIIDIILDAFSDNLLSTSNSNFILDANALLVLAFVTLGIYLAAFKYASFIVGEDAGSMATSMGMKAVESVMATGAAQKVLALFQKSEGGKDSADGDNPTSAANDLLGGGK